MTLNQFHERGQNISEIFYLLHFFSKTPSEQWDVVPNDFVPIRIETFSIQCTIYNQVLFLTCIFVRSVEKMLYENCNFESDTFDILIEEIYPLINSWMLPYYFYQKNFGQDYESIFEKEEEISERNKIWLVLRKLCQIALSFEDWSKYEIKELSFEYFVENHSYPYDPLV
jgi:hypothetical protein